MPELRALSTELRASSDDGAKRIAGYAATFNSETQIGAAFSLGGGYKETIDAAAFNRCLASPDLDCRALFNHNPDAILGRSRSGTLKLSVLSAGLHYEVKLPSNSLGDSVFESVKRRDVSGSSFGFNCREDAWDGNTRTLLDVDLFDCGPVVFPAYQETSVQVRSAAGTTERVKIGWYRAGKLHLPLIGQEEMRSKARKLRRELRQDDDAPANCTCECSACQSDDCENCVCESTDCPGTDCSSEHSADCHCLTTREVAGRMRLAPGRTLYPPDAGPLWREQFERDRTLEQQLFNSRRVMKLWRR